MHPTLKKLQISLRITPALKGHSKIEYPNDLLLCFTREKESFINSRMLRAFSGSSLGSTLSRVLDRKMTLLAAARKHLTVDAFIQQTDDAHGSEYTCPTDNRRPEVSGFTGSAGTAVFTKTEAALWTDGRYFLQV